MDDVVRMVREEPMFPGGPTAADVAVSEVQNWEAAGWRVPDDETATDPGAGETGSSENATEPGTGETETAGEATGEPTEETVVDVNLDEMDKDALVELAIQLQLDSPSNIKRWGEDKLRTEIQQAAETAD